MSVAFASVEVAAGPTVGFKGHGRPAATAVVGVREFIDRVAAARAGEGRGPVKGEGDDVVVGRNGYGVLGQRRGGRQQEEGEEDRVESSESSSIGVGGESSLSLSSSTAGDRADGEEEEVQSKPKKDALGSLESLEECLPIKRGLSNCFTGKSKSFASLADAAALGSARGLAKPENPFNKRRRVLMACKASWQRRASYAALNTSSLRALEEDEEDEEDEGDERAGREEERGDGDTPPASSSPSPMERRRFLHTFRSPRSFSLTDLQRP